MFGGETTRCGRALLITNFLLSFACLVALSTILLYLTFHSKNNPEPSPPIWDNPWNDDTEINKICGFNEHPVLQDDGSKYGKLRWLGALFRHGDRTPIWFLDSDPYKDYDWPEGHEMLTNIGRRRMFCYGVALRKRYANYLDTVKTPNVIAFSSWYRRTIETNDLVLTGAFPPTYKNSWAPTLAIGKQWQAIGVGSAEFARSWMLLDEAVCPAAEKIQNSVQPVLSKEDRDFMAKLAKLTSSVVETVDDVYHIYDTLLIEKAYFGADFKEPSWIAEAGNDTLERMKAIVALSFNQHQNDLNFLRLRSGVFLEQLHQITNNVTNTTLDLSPMVHTFSSHDTAISPIIQALGLYKEPPTYGSGMVFELRQTSPDKYIMRLIYVDVFDNNHFIEMDLSKSWIFDKLCLGQTCDLETFFQTLEDKKLLIELKNIEKECELKKRRAPFYEKPFFPKREPENE